MDYGGYDLGKFLKLAPTLKGWSEHHVRFISWQILAGLNYLHSANIAHRVGVGDSKCTSNKLENRNINTQPPKTENDRPTREGPETDKHFGDSRQPRQSDRLWSGAAATAYGRPNPIGGRNSIRKNGCGRQALP